MLFMKHVKAIIFAAMLLALTAPAVANAGIVPGCAQQAGGCARIEQLIQLGINYGKFILGLSGGLALVFFIYGGILMLTSGGSPDKVKKGRDTLVAATIGLIIIFGAFTAIKFALQILDPTGTYDMYVNPKKK